MDQRTASLGRAAIILSGFFLALSSSLASAAGWRLTPGLLPPSQVERLAERYPTIRSADTLERLLQDIGRRTPTVLLEAHFKNGMWSIEGKRAPIVSDIEIELTSRFLQSPLYGALQAYVGQVDSPETQEKIAETARRYLKRRGYPQAKVVVKTDQADGETTYLVVISEANPCIISRIELGFKLPDDVSLTTNIGDICDRDEILNSLNELELDLRDKGYNQLKIELANISYDLEHDTAVIHISGVLGQRVRYEIVDQNRRFLIDDLFTDDELTKVDPTIIGPDAMAAELVRRYRNRGFSDVVIDGPDVKKAGDDEFVYTYRIEPGRQYLLKSVRFEGARHFSEAELLETMGFTSLWQSTRPVNFEEIQAGLDAIRARYQQEGYWDVEIRDPGNGQKDRETGTVRLTIPVNEGRQRILQKVSVKGAEALSIDEIAGLINTKIGTPLDRSKLVELQQGVRGAYIARGYLYANTEIDLKANETRAKTNVEVIVTIQEGPRVRIGEISIIGLVRTEEKVVHRELLFAPGDWYDPELIAQSRQALTRLGLFRSVQIAPANRNANAEKDRELDLVIDVREGKAGSVGFGPGWSLYRGWNYEAEAAYNNIGGMGRQASIRGQLSEEAQQEAIGSKTLVGRKLGAGYVEPYIFDLPFNAILSANQKAEWATGLWELSYGGEVALQHHLRTLMPGSTVAIFYGQKIAKTEGSQESVDELVATDVRIGRVGVRFSADERDNLKFPTAGWVLDAEAAWARYDLGGDLRYFRWDVSTSKYFALATDVVLAFGINLTSYEGIERKSPGLIGILPPTERLPAGGSESVRGYRPRSLGPAVRSPDFNSATATVDGVETRRCNVSYSSNRLDGNRRTVIKTEIRYKVNDSIALTAFTDNGVSFFTQDQMKKFEQEYAEPVKPPLLDDADPCASHRSEYRSIENNIGYNYADLIKNPGYIWSRHYHSYGFSFNLLTALGAINFGYGLPWHEPKTEACALDKSYCDPRSKQGGHWIARGEFHLNVGARF